MMVAAASKKSLKIGLFLDAGAFSQLKGSKNHLPRLTNSLKSPDFLDAGAFSEFKMSESEPARLKNPENRLFF